MKGQGGINRKTTTPVNVPRTRRQHNIVNLTSLPAGKAVPIAAIPLLREDAASVNIAVAFEMQETVEVLLNPVNVVVEAWLFPTLASDRFRTLDDVNLAYTGNAREGEAVVPYVEKMVGGAPGANEILMRLGKHYKPTDQVNAMFNEAYNEIWNHRAQNISPDIELRDRLATTLAPAFWPNNKFQYIVADFDQAAMEGEVALTVREGKMPITGLAISERGDVLNQNGADSTGANVAFPGWGVRDVGAVNGPGNAKLLVKAKGYGASQYPDIYAELAENGITVSLANIKMAQQTQAWAQIRKKYSQLSEEMLIDLLMDGISIPEQGWRQPIPLGRATTQFGMAKRYASDGEALTQSVVNGAAGIEMRISTPRVPCGGVIMFIAEIAPEQMFERMEDPFLHVVGTTGDAFPAYLPDMADPEKVDIVKNRVIDIDHDQPDDVLGYEPLNARYNRTGPGIGGRFYRPEVDAPFDEDRQMFWAVETQNPTLTKDWYLVPEDIHLKPFWTSTIDPFDAITRGVGVITGNTVFGGVLVEATGISDYDLVAQRIPTERIQKD